MTEMLSFPGLGLEIPINPVAFTVFGRAIYWYGIMFALAFLAAAFYLLRRVKLFGIDEDRMIDVLLGAVIGGVIGARLYYVAFMWDTYKGDLARIFRVWEGGIAMYGSIIGGVLAILIMCRWRKVKLLPVLDLFATALILAQSIGRWGNFFNMEAFGSNTDLPWGMTSPTIERFLTHNVTTLEQIGVQVDPTAPVHPTFFYESVWCLLGFLFLMWFTKRRRYDGELTLMYIGWYGLGRFFIEGLRTDSLLIGSLRVSQLVAILCVVASLAIMAYVRARIKKSDDPENYLQLYVDTEEGQQILAGTFYTKNNADEAKVDTDKDGDEEEDDPDSNAAEESAEAAADKDGDPDADDKSDTASEDSDPETEIPGDDSDGPDADAENTGEDTVADDEKPANADAGQDHPVEVSTADAAAEIASDKAPDKPAES